MVDVLVASQQHKSVHPLISHLNTVWNH